MGGEMEGVIMDFVLESGVPDELADLRSSLV
jgi:hypothetical protein